MKKEQKVLDGVTIGITAFGAKPTTDKCTTSIQCNLFNGTKGYCNSINNCPNDIDRDEVEGGGNNFHKCIVSIASSPLYNLSINGIYNNNTSLSSSACLPSFSNQTDGKTSSPSPKLSPSGEPSEIHMTGSFPILKPSTLPSTNPSTYQTTLPSTNPLHTK